MKRWKKRPAYRGPQWLRGIFFAAASLLMGYLIAREMLLINFADAATLAKWTAKYPTYFPLTMLLYALLVWTLGALLGRMWLAGLLVGGGAVGLAAVDYFKTVINGTPLSLADFGLATQLGEVAGVAGTLELTPQLWNSLALIAVCTVLLSLARRWLRLTGTPRFLAAGLSLALSVGMITPWCASAVGNRFGVDVYARMPAAANNRLYGLTLALWRDSILQHTTEPDGYSEAYMARVLSRIDELLAEEELTADAVQPNVIMILSEAFFDLTALPDLTFDRDPVENLHALEQESISGTFFSHYLGYGTGYIEMSLLYGITNHDFGPSTNLCFMEDEHYDLFDALPEQFTGSGAYRAEMLHAYNDSLYNRTVTYPLMGYDQLYFSADMQELGVEWGGSKYGGYYLKDSYTYKTMLERMRAINEGGKRAFLFGITMENHQPFDVEKFGGACQIGVESDVLSDEDLEIAKVMVEGITRADQALGGLMEALRQTEEPTIVVYFGDHRPNLFLTDGDTIYTKYGLSPSNETTEWTADQVADLYSTDYLIWANDPALLQGREGEARNSSVTAIGPELLKLLGVEPSRYWGLLGKVSEAVLTDADLYFADGESRITRSAETAELTAEQRELLELRQAVIYDAFYGEQYVTAEMNLPAGTNE